ncbi:MAG: sulfotransferase, partial [Pseudomonadota bacterium]
LGNEQCVCGELTVDYCALSAEAVDHVYRQFPHLRIVFVLRNPVDRAWSQAKKLAPKLLDKPLAELTDNDLLRYLEHPAARERGDYPRALRHWETRFGAAQLFVGFYDELVAAPARFLRSIEDFLGVPGRDLDSATKLAVPVNASPSATRVRMPVAIRQALIDLYRDDVAALAARFGGYAAEWQRDFEQR